MKSIAIWIALLGLWPARVHADPYPAPLSEQDGGASLSLPAGRPLLFVTHGAAGMDRKSVAKAGIDRAVRVFRSLSWPVLYLICCPDGKLPITREQCAPYMEDRRPTAHLCSTLGNHKVRVTTAHIFIAGGSDDACAKSSAWDAAESALAHLSRRRASRRPAVTLHFLADAMWSSRALEDGPPPLLFSDYGQEVMRRSLEARYASFPRYSAHKPEVRLYQEGTFVKRLASGDSPDSPLLIIRLTTTESLAKEAASQAPLDQGGASSGDSP